MTDEDFAPTLGDRPLPPLTLINGPRQLKRMQERIKDEAIVAIDTESNSLHAYHERVCLIQLSVPAADYIIDPLSEQFHGPPAEAFAAFGDLLRNPNVQKIFHAAEYDLIGFKRDYQFEVVNIFDTMQAARILGWPQVGLGSLLEKHFGLTLDKRLQRADWAQRPLSQELLAYARLDTRYLFDLRELMLAELRQAGRLPEAEEEFARLAAMTEFVDRPFDAEGFWRINRANELNARQLAVLRELYIYREQQAERLNRPPFKIMGDQVLIELALQQPENIDGLRDAGLSSHQLQRYGQGVLAALARGRQAPPPAPPQVRARPDDVILARYDALRLWRKARAKDRGVESDIILPREALWALARQIPRTLEALAEIPGLGPWRRQEYGEEIIKILSKLK